MITACGPDENCLLLLELLSVVEDYELALDVEELWLLFGRHRLNPALDTHKLTTSNW